NFWNLPLLNLSRYIKFLVFWNPRNKNPNLLNSVPKHHLLEGSGEGRKGSWNHRISACVVSDGAAPSFFNRFSSLKAAILPWRKRHSSQIKDSKLHQQPYEEKGFEQQERKIKVIWILELSCGEGLLCDAPEILSEIRKATGKCTGSYQ
ncbi:hypothetical protein PIB30_097650, partial [Stylosanthes scabra]|nr:hypothetical protein [Stylosanthes scabra]